MHVTLEYNARKYKFEKASNFGQFRTHLRRLQIFTFARYFEDHNFFLYFLKKFCFFFGEKLPEDAIKRNIVKFFPSNRYLFDNKFHRQL